MNEFSSAKSHWIMIGGLLAAAAVGFGAFGAHFMEDYLAPFENGERRMEVWKTAAHYHIVHALALIAVGLTPTLKPRLKNVAAAFLMVGILIFSGLLYTYSVTDIRILGAFVPIGGVSLIVGWVLFTISAAGVGGLTRESDRAA